MTEMVLSQLRGRGGGRVLTWVRRPAFCVCGHVWPVEMPAARIQTEEERMEKELGGGGVLE